MRGAPTVGSGWQQHGHAMALRFVVAVMCAALAAPCSLMSVQAQTSPRPAVTIASVISAEPASQSAFPISVGPTGAVPRNAFVRVRGLPTMAALSGAHTIAPGAWAIPLNALPDLKITLPPGAAGRTELVVTLVAVDGSVLAEAKSVLAINATPANKAATQRDPPAPATASILRAGVPLQTPPAEAGAPPPRTSPEPVTPADRERAVRLMKKGDSQLEEGNVPAARLLYERAADGGLAEAAMALAATYDKAEFARLKLRGVAPDAKEARRWYERARQLGAGGADERLRRIGAN